MKKTCLLLAMQLIFYASSYAIEIDPDYIPANIINCIVESCDGWEVRYDTSPIKYGMGGSDYDKAGFYVYNNTGDPAFRVKIVVRFSDMFGKTLGRVEKISEGPIFEKIVFIGDIPVRTYKMDASVFYSKTHEQDSVKSNIIQEK